MQKSPLVLPFLGIASLFVVPAARGYFILSQTKKVLHSAEDGYTLNSADIYLTMNGHSDCSCRKACEVDMKCKHSALDATNLCHLTANPKPYLVAYPGATFLRQIKPASDGLYYIVNNREKVSYHDAVARCANMPGFRIAQAKTRANVEAMVSFFEDVPNWNGYAFIGMTKQTDGSLKWQDGTPVDMSIFAPGEPKMKNPGGSLFHINPTMIVEINAGTVAENMYGYLCQANFNYLVW